MNLTQRLQAARHQHDTLVIEPAIAATPLGAEALTPNVRAVIHVPAAIPVDAHDDAPVDAPATAAGAPAPQDVLEDTSAVDPVQPGPTAPVQPGRLGRLNADERPAVKVMAARDALDPLRERASQALFERIGGRLNDPSLNERQLHGIVRTELNHVVDEEKIPLTDEQRQRLIAEVADDVLGHGPLQRCLDDPEVTEIMVNGPEMIYIERGGQLVRADGRFSSEEHLRRVIERIVTRVGRRIDEASPLVDARLPDGSRVNAIIPPLAFNGSSLTIRKFSTDPYRVDDLIRFGTITPEMAELLHACVAARLNVIVSGGTGTGKTTLLNVLSSFIPHGERIVTIEDAIELQLQQDHVVRLESRPSNVEGRGEVSIRDLVRNSLRMRPDRIVVGEVRGGESLDMLQAMNTGHDGSLSTVHANSPRDAIARLETLVLMAGMELPLRAIREQIASAVDVIVQLSRLRDGSRRVTAVTEVQGMEGQTVTLQDAFVFDYRAGVDSQGRIMGRACPTGVRPRFTDRFDELGITLSADLFGGAGIGAYR